ncbi:MAG: PTS sugar transporter subunit IIC [Gemmatimonadetes bacterium]|nr:PTS sugar transporter subunit IIC [Gemmatimonadota bacterium]
MAADLVVAALLGGLLGLDGTSFGQFMVSRPFVAATLAGALVGAPVYGAAVGAVLELFQLCVLPVGGARFPESGPAAVAAALTAAAAPGAAGLALGVALGLVWEGLGGASITYLRLLNSRFVPDPITGPVTPRHVTQAHLTALSLDFARGALLASTGATLGLLVAPHLAVVWPLDERHTAGMLTAAAAAPMGVLLRTFGGWQRWRWLFLAGLAAGTVAAVTL